MLAFDRQRQRQAAGVRNAIEFGARRLQHFLVVGCFFGGPEPAAGGIVEELGAGQGEGCRGRQGVVPGNLVGGVGGGLAGGRRRHRNAAARGPQGAAEGGGVLETVGAVLLQGLHQHAVQRVGDVGIEAAGGLGDLANVLVGHGDGAVADERRPAGQHLVEKASGGVQVAARVDGFAPGLFRGQVLRRAHDGLRLRHGGGRIRHGAGDPEVHDLDAV